MPNCTAVISLPSEVTAYAPAKSIEYLLRSAENTRYTVLLLEWMFSAPIIDISVPAPSLSNALPMSIRMVSCPVGEPGAVRLRYSLVPGA